MKQAEGGEVKQVAGGKMTVAARGKMMQAARGKMGQAARGKENLVEDYRATKMEERILLGQVSAPYSHETNKWRAGHFPLALRLEEGHLS